ncbi:MAG: phosphatidate cytidylyltransferase [Actinomycetia bacterium]|nr:phosphatidate cytidylyltransferase [Actinomycetes bacterium]
MGPDELHQPGHPGEQGGGLGDSDGSGDLGPGPAGPEALSAEPDPEPRTAEPPPPTEILKPSRAGRNLRAAIAVGVIMGALALITLFTVKVIFLVYMAAVIALGLWELTRALEARGIRLPLVPVAAGGAAMLALAYYSGERPLVGVLAVTVIAILAWRMPGGSRGYLRDVTAGVFALAYLPLMASFVGLMLAAPDGSRRVLAWIVVTVCSDIGGYLVGSLLGRHPMAAVISPNKTWEGFAGSALACIVAGVLLLPLLLHGTWWQGVVVGVAAVGAATLGDLSESMIKRDLQIKDMGTVLPGHGGILDRIDSLLITAPVVWLLLVVFL